MKYLTFILAATLLFSCSEDENNDEANKSGKDNEETTLESTDPKDRIVRDGNKYTEYYESSKKNIKFEGMLNDAGEREGKWVYYFIDGKEGSITNYKNGIEDGFSIVKRKTYDENGKLLSETEHTDSKVINSIKEESKTTDTK
jgi:antitoxin component YwqK of YwqJK toxin-antitoxin module